MSGRSILIVTADRLFAEVAPAYLNDFDGFRVVGVARDGMAGVAAVSRLSPEAVLIHGELSRLSSAALSRQVRRRWPSVVVVGVAASVVDGSVALPGAAPVSEVLDALLSAPAEAPADLSAADQLEALRRLTPRERAVLMRLGQGRSPAQIADELGVTRNTMRKHLQNLYAKLGVHSRLEIVRYALERGLVNPDAATR